MLPLFFKLKPLYSTGGTGGGDHETVTYFLFTFYLRFKFCYYRIRDYLVSVSEPILILLMCESHTVCCRAVLIVASIL